MSLNKCMPHMMKARLQALHHIEAVILDHVPSIEAWFRKRWLETPPPITSSVDLRHAGFKLAPVDTNLFPAGFNNLNQDFQPLYVQAAQAVLTEYLPMCTNLLILPEMHTRNQFYMQSLFALKEIFSKAGVLVRIGSLDETLQEPMEIAINAEDFVRIEPIIREGNRMKLADFTPCAILLNNDLSSGVPEILKNIEQPIYPNPHLGWSNRLKSTHFRLFDDVANAFAQVIGIDPWLINPLFSCADGIDFMSQTGIEQLAHEVDRLLALIRDKYQTYGIDETPFVAVKADNGTYGMSVMMVQDAASLLQLNRKQRTKMSASKGSRKVSKVLIQEGVISSESMPDGSVAEPVVYMLGQYVIGGFYRVHQDRGRADNLNAPGMHFEPLTFAHACNSPCDKLKVDDTPNLFYVYGVIARLAALAAAHEMRLITQEGV